MDINTKRDATLILRLPAALKERIESTAAKRRRRPTDQTIVLLLDQIAAEEQALATLDGKAA